jgi:small-conductance mechanosensitive channel
MNRKKIKDVFKVIFICSVILFTLIISYLYQEVERMSSVFSLSSAALISIGFAAPIVIVKQNYKCT